MAKPPSAWIPEGLRGQRPHTHVHTRSAHWETLNGAATSRVSQPSPGLSVTAALLSSHKTSLPCNSKCEPKNGQRRSRARREMATSRPLKGPGCPAAGQLTSGRIRGPRLVRRASCPSSPRSLGIIKQELHRPGRLSYQPGPLICKHTSSSQEPNGPDDQAHLNTLRRNSPVSGEIYS